MGYQEREIEKRALRRFVCTVPEKARRFGLSVMGLWWKRNTLKAEMQSRG